MKQCRFIFSLALITLMLALPVQAGKETNTYQVPDVREAFCGPEIAPRHCKCAFHNQCGDGMDSDTSYTLVLNGFHDWNRQKIQQMGESCKRFDGHWDVNSWTCTRCTDGDERVGTRCVEPAKVDPEVAECRQAEKDFERDWKKFSDFDERIPVSEASTEVQEYDRVLGEIADMIAEIQEIEFQLELAREYRIELREYKQALVQNIKVNLLKSFWRLSYITYNVIDGGKGGAESFRKAINPDNVLEGVSSGIKVIQAHIPGHAKNLQFNTASTSGQVGSILWNSGVEALDTLGDPKAVAIQFTKDVRGAAIGGPDLSDEEIAILRTQHLDNKAVDDALSDSYAETYEMRARQFTLEALISQKYNELQDWKAKEYERVQLGLLEQCKDKLE